MQDEKVFGSAPQVNLTDSCIRGGEGLKIDPAYCARVGKNLGDKTNGEGKVMCPDLLRGETEVQGEGRKVLMNPVYFGTRDG